MSRYHGPGDYSGGTTPRQKARDRKRWQAEESAARTWLATQMCQARAQCREPAGGACQGCRQVAEKLCALPEFEVQRDPLTLAFVLRGGIV